MPLDHLLSLTELDFVAFDTETSGAYPLESEIVEFGAVKWSKGQIVDEYQTLLKPRQPMSQFIIGIHGISNEMVENAPLMSEKIHEIYAFLSGSVVMAHHAPFDLGFLTPEFEKYHCPIPDEAALCTSLLARKLIHESPNHKLQTLIQVLKIPQGQAHRALDDAKACLEVGLECFRRLGQEATLAEALKVQAKPLKWSQFQLLESLSSTRKTLIEAIMAKKDIDIVYEGGSVRSRPRRVTPIGIVRNPDGDYIMANCHLDRATKRFYIDKISDVAMVF